MVSWCEMKMLIALLMLAALRAEDVPVLTSVYSSKDLPLTADAKAKHWREIKGITTESDFSGQAVPGHRTEVRSRWTNTHLYLLYVNRYDAITLTPNPVGSGETPKLWDWDVSEAFIGSDFAKITRYKEFQVSPRGEYIDLDIDRGNPQSEGAGWNSGFEVKARIDEANKTWYGEMKIPFSAIDTRSPAVSNELRVGLFRIEGAAPKRTYVSWRSTNGKSFHVPEQFGTLRLVK